MFSSVAPISSLNLHSHSLTLILTLKPRQHRNRDRRNNHREKKLLDHRRLQGNVKGKVLFGLSVSVDLSSLAEDLSALLSIEKSGAVPTVASSEYKLRATVLNEEFHFAK